jgi:hypothetical protein
MKLSTSQGGRFSLKIEAKDLAGGLRPSKRNPRNRPYLVTCKGAVGRDGVLQVLDQLTRLDTSAIKEAFPFPQIFFYNEAIVVCFSSAIYEWDGGLTSKIAGLTRGSTWEAADDFILLTNGKVSVWKNPMTREYETIATLPHGTALSNFNGQIFVGAPDCDADGADLTFPANAPTIQVQVVGSYGS